MSDARQQTAEEAARYHRWFAVEANNTTWEMIEKADRTPYDEDVMIARAHAAWYHWSYAGEAQNLAIADWLCAHVYTILRRSEPARFHAERCLRRCLEHQVADFPLAYAWCALARLGLLEGDRAAYEANLAKAREAGAAIADTEDRAIFESDLAALEAEGALS